MSSSPLQATWVLELEVLPELHAALAAAVKRAGHSVVAWSDDWWASGDWRTLGGRPVVFHGSLENAARIAAELPWRPGSYCKTEAFACSAWYEAAEPWLVHRKWWILPAVDLVSNRMAVLHAIDSPASAFIRPDSPLKPFTGRVLPVGEITLAALDHGFYFEDEKIPVVAAPVQEIEREWRYVVVDRKVIAGSAYEASTRSAIADDPTGAPWAFAALVASRLEPPERVYVLDVCEAQGELRLLELNPFSGADLYGCRLDDVVEAVSRCAIDASLNSR